MDQFNFFNLFDDEELAPPAIEENETKESKKAKGSKKAKDTKGTEKKGSKANFTLPIHLYMTNCEEMVVEIEGKTEISDIELTEYLTQNYKYIPNSLNFTKGNTGVIITLTPSYNSKIGVSEDTVCYFGSQVIDLMPLLKDSDDSVELSKTDLQKYLSDALGYPEKSIDYFVDKSAIYIVLKADTTVEDLTYCTVKPIGYGDELITVGKTESEETSDGSALVDDSAFNPFDDADEVGEDVPPVEENEKGEDDEEKSSKPSKLTLDNIREKVSELHPEFKGHCGLIWCKESGVYHAFFVNYEISSGSSSPKKAKEEKFSVDGTTLSLVFNKYVLSPDDFDGKKEVTKKELCSYLLKKDYPEYTADRTNFLFDKKSKLIIAQIQGSRKGAELVELPELRKELDEKTYVCRDVEFCSETFRVEKNPIGIFSNSRSSSKGCFKMLLPKIPKSILFDIMDMFKQHNIDEVERGEICTEMALQVFWNDKARRYFIYQPKQFVYPEAVDIERNCVLESEFLLVMDIHSHNVMPAFFSGVDNADEKGTRLYMVVGKTLSDEMDIKLRAGNGGLFRTLNVADVFNI